LGRNGKTDLYEHFVVAYDFAIVKNMNNLPPLNWLPAGTGHGIAWETSILGTGYNLKLYLQGGQWTIAVVKPTNTWGHYFDAAYYYTMVALTLYNVLGDSGVNLNNAQTMMTLLPPPPAPTGPPQPKS
jgi:hypothetical protein